MRPRQILAQLLAGKPARLIERLAGTTDPVSLLLLRDPAGGILLADATGAILHANETLRRMLARRVDLSPGQHLEKIFATEEREATWRELRTILAGRTPLVLVSRLDAADPDPDHAVTIAALPVAEADGVVSGLVLRITDITLQRRLEAQLAHSQKLQAVGQLAGGIAHDFNNLLTAIAGAAEMVQDRAEVDAATRADVAQIRRGAERGAALVRQLLAFGRQQRLQPRVLAINDAIQDVSGLLRRLLGSQVRLELDLETPGRLVRVDPTQLDQVLVNLAVNASDAMPDGGTLTLHSGHVTLYRALTRGQETIPPGRYVMIEVRDTGIGIPADVLPRIFEPFFTTRRDRGGTGLGLSTVHGIVRQSDGFLTVDSEPGQGTSLRIYLPRHEGPETPEAPGVLETMEEKPAAGGRVVLLVDDEEMVRALTARALTQRGWTVLACDSAESALERLRERDGKPGESPLSAPLAALVSDVVMPGMDGPALVRAVRARHPDVPAILISGYAEEGLRAGLASEKIFFLPKPYTMQALGELLRRVLAEPADSAVSASSGP